MKTIENVQGLIESGETFTCENGSTGSFSIGRAGTTISPDDAIIFHGENVPRKVGNVMGEGRKAAITFPRKAYGPVPTGAVTFTVLRGRGAEFAPKPKAVEDKVAKLFELCEGIVSAEELAALKKAVE